MNKISLFLFVTVTLLACSSSKTYFTPQVRAKIEKAGVDLKQVQYYVDRNMELKREVSKEEAQLSKGKIKIENGKYINIITLQKNTPGICSGIYADKILVSFETGENKFLTFGKTKFAGALDPYKILAFEWGKNGEGMIRYEGNAYHITNGTEASVQISSKFIRRADKIEKRQMQGVKITSN